MFLGPLCLLTFLAILFDSPKQHPARLLACCCHVYGVMLYFATGLIQGNSHCRPEALYFWGYYVGFNIPWLLVPVGGFQLWRWGSRVLMCGGQGSPGGRCVPLAVQWTKRGGGRRSQLGNRFSGSGESSEPAAGGTRMFRRTQSEGAENLSETGTSWPHGYLPHYETPDLAGQPFWTPSAERYPFQTTNV